MTPDHCSMFLVFGDNGSMRHALNTLDNKHIQGISKMGNSKCSLVFTWAQFWILWFIFFVFFPLGQCACCWTFAVYASMSGLQCEPARDRSKGFPGPTAGAVPVPSVRPQTLRPPPPVSSLKYFTFFVGQAMHFKKFKIQRFKSLSYFPKTVSMWELRYLWVDLCLLWLALNCDTMDPGLQLVRQPPQLMKLACIM